MGRLQTLAPRVATLEISRATRLPKVESYGRGRGGRPWRRTAERIKLRDRCTCYVCKRVTLEGDVDHKVPLSQGGTDDDSNLGWICRVPCHREKTQREAQAAYGSTA